MVVMPAFSVIKILSDVVIFLALDDWFLAVPADREVGRIRLETNLHFSGPPV
jgi:hypothetical protein